MSACLVRSYSELENVWTLAPSDSASRTTLRPRKPRPPVTVTRLPVQKPRSLELFSDIFRGFISRGQALIALGSPDFTAAHMPLCRDRSLAPRSLRASPPGGLR